MEEFTLCTVISARFWRSFWKDFRGVSGNVLEASVSFWKGFGGFFENILEASASFLEKVLKILARFQGRFRFLGCFGECSRSFVELSKPTIDA